MQSTQRLTCTCRLRYVHKQSGCNGGGILCVTEHAPSRGCAVLWLRQLVAAHLLVLRCYVHNSMAFCTIWIPSCKCSVR